MRWRTIIAAVLMTFSGIAQAQPSPESEVGVWTRYPTSYPAGTEAEYQSWYNLAYDTNRDVFYGVDWFGVISKFDPIAQRWTKLSPNVGGGTHNRVLAYDPVNAACSIRARPRSSGGRCGMRPHPTKGAADANYGVLTGQAGSIRHTCADG